MAAIFVLSLCLVYAIVREIIPLIKEGYVKDAGFYSVIFLGGAALSYFAINETKIQSPMILLQVIYGPIIKALGL